MTQESGKCHTIS